MICPLTGTINRFQPGSFIAKIQSFFFPRAKDSLMGLSCSAECAWWDDNKKQCAVLTLSKLVISGGINAHPY